MTHAAHAPAPTRRRSVLSVPASDERKSAKALASVADEVVLDLEDAVVPGEKDAARELVCRTLLAQPERVAGRTAVRVNAPGSAWCHLDLQALAALPTAPVSVVVPKVESAADLAFVDRLLDGAEARSGRSAPLRVQALVESAAGLARVHEIAHASARLEALVLGYADLAASLGTVGDPATRPELWLPAQSAVLVAARSAGLAAVDGPHLGVEVDDGLRAAAARARDLGFDGKWAIHPRQLEHLNDVFTPDEEQLRSARAVLDALARGRDAGAGAVALDGRMLDEAVAAAARRLLARSS
jgi:citrate lyase subunit beta / citryl-CoA lyase